MLPLLQHSVTITLSLQDYLTFVFNIGISCKNKMFLVIYISLSHGKAVALRGNLCSCGRNSKILR